MLRIGFDARTIDWSGRGTYARNLLAQYAARDLELVVFCPDDKRDSVPDCDSFTFVAANVDPLSRSGRAVFASIVERADVDLLHVPSHLAATPVGVPFVATVHDVIPLILPRSVRNPVARLRYRRQLDRTLAAARCIITVSRISRSTLTAYAGVDPARVRVIHNGVSRSFGPIDDPQVLASVRRRYSLPEHFALWIGEFLPHKNLEFLVRGWSEVTKRTREAPVLVLAGAQRGEFRKITREVRRHGIEDRVIFPGFIRDNDLPSVYCASRLFVFPSLYEGFGLPPLEAMACGTPCVVSNSSSLPEVTGRAAMMFNPTSTEQFVECVVRILDDGDLDGKLRREGLRQAGLFSWERAAAETIEVYETLGV